MKDRLLYCRTSPLQDPSITSSVLTVHPEHTAAIGRMWPFLTSESVQLFSTVSSYLLTLLQQRSSCWSKFICSISCKGHSKHCSRQSSLMSPHTEVTFLAFCLRFLDINGLFTMFSVHRGSPHLHANPGLPPQGVWKVVLCKHSLLQHPGSLVGGMSFHPHSFIAFISFTKDLKTHFFR